MAIGLGARKSNMDQKYFVSASQDNYVTGGVAAGPEGFRPTSLAVVAVLRGWTLCLCGYGVSLLVRS